jgi:hypothetical protein
MQLKNDADIQSMHAHASDATQHIGECHRTSERFGVTGSSIII